ncbi:MAG TPA: alpha/beta fold hydrolase [Candidatus Acidoferrales bacterium]
MKEFQPAFLLRNPHLMTMAGAFWRRSFPFLPAAEPREFETEPGTRVLAKCHWQTEPRRHSTIALLHGLEGSSESGYMRGIAEKAFREGFNVIRVNQRNCGGTDHLTPSLYNSGLSNDMRAIVAELIAQDKLPEIFVVGFSMGGNLVLKMAGEMADSAPPELRGVIAVCPAANLAACADALNERQNIIYQRHFVRSLKKHTRFKAGLFPERYPLNGLDGVRTVREFDDAITAKFCGYRDADDYYYRASALRVADAIRVPTIIISAQDDPIVPIQTLRDVTLTSNRHITIVTPQYGGHGGFISRESGDERFWVEARIVEYCVAKRTL